MPPRLFAGEGAMREVHELFDDREMRSQKCGLFHYNFLFLAAADEFTQPTFFLHAITDFIPDVHKLAVNLPAVKVYASDVTAQRIFVVAGQEAAKIDAVLLRSRPTRAFFVTGESTAAVTGAGVTTRRRRISIARSRSVQNIRRVSGSAGRSSAAFGIHFGGSTAATAGNRSAGIIRDRSGFSNGLRRHLTVAGVKR